MKKLKFTLQDDDKLIIDEITEYNVDSDNYMYFKIDNYVIKFNIYDYIIHFIRETDDNIFEIKYDDDNLNSTIKLKNMPKEYTFDLDIDDFTYDIDKEKSIAFTYKINGDDSLKKIFIHFI